MRAISLMAFLLLPSAAVAAPIPKVSCIARRQDTVVYDRSTKKTHEDESWVVDCSITIEDKRIYAGPLSLPSPASFQEAMSAIQEFRTKRAPDIAKQYLKEGK